MTWFDLIIIAVLALSTFFAVVRGGLKEVGTLIALGMAGFGAFALMKPVQAAFGLSKSFITTALIGAVLAVIAFAVLYVLLHFGLKRVTLAGRAQTADRIGGGVFGLLRGLALIGLGYLAYSYYLDEARRPRAVTAALTLPIAAGMAKFFEGFAPEGSGLEEPTKEPQANAAADGYARGDRSALSEIVSTVTTTDGPAAAVVQPVEGDPIGAAIREAAPE